ncbi:hypothetical protein CSUI_010381 [Cystoisospora suis]|uniref:Uncharacterized protein n=1 Tax=Cystoisospora suis TaxID=483139 RepID=A0A2C6KFB3_9APIC|nr:hypothetical protein CSUI_010381 [Cystoisospora suis]
MSKPREVFSFVRSFLWSVCIPDILLTNARNTMASSRSKPLQPAVSASRFSLIVSLTLMLCLGVDTAVHAMTTNEFTYANSAVASGESSRSNSPEGRKTAGRSEGTEAADGGAPERRLSSFGEMPSNGDGGSEGLDEIPDGIIDAWIEQPPQWVLQSRPHTKKRCLEILQELANKEGEVRYYSPLKTELLSYFLAYEMIQKPHQDVAKRRKPFASWYSTLRRSRSRPSVDRE